MIRFNTLMAPSPDQGRKRHRSTSSEENNTPANMQTQLWQDDIEFDSDGFEIFTAVNLPTPATVEIYNTSSDTEKASSPAPSPIFTVSVAEEASITVVSASPSGTLRDEWSQRMTLQKGDLLSVKRAAEDDHAEAPQMVKAERTPAGLGESKSRNIAVDLSEDSPASASDSNIELGGSCSSSTSGDARPNRFARLRDNRFLRTSRRPQKEVIRSPPKKPRLGANLSHNVGSRRIEAQTPSKLAMRELDQENQAPVEGGDLLFD